MSTEYAQLGDQATSEQRYLAARAALKMMFGGVWLDHRDSQVHAACGKLFEFAAGSDESESYWLEAAEELGIMDIPEDGDYLMAESAKDDLRGAGLIVPGGTRYWTEVVRLGRRNVS